MTNNNFVPLSREHFALLREAKRLIANEFQENLTLQGSNILDRIHVFAQTSNSNRLLDIWTELKAPEKNSTEGYPGPANDSVMKPNGEPKNNDDRPKGAIKVGDTVNGKKCTGFYRGQPVFK